MLFSRRHRENTLFLLPTPKIQARSPRGQTGMKPRDLVFGLFAPSTFEHTYPVRSDVYSHLPFTLTLKQKKKKNKNKKKKTERKSSQTNLRKNKKKGRIIGYTRHDTNFCSGTSARSQCVYSLWSKETSRSETVGFIPAFKTSLFTIPFYKYIVYSLGYLTYTFQMLKSFLFLIETRILSPSYSFQSNHIP